MTEKSEKEQVEKLMERDDRSLHLKDLRILEMMLVNWNTENCSILLDPDDIARVLRRVSSLRAELDAYYRELNAAQQPGDKNGQKV